MDLEALTAEVAAQLGDADAALARDYPGDRPGRQPVHTFYLPGDRFHERTVQDLGFAAQKVVFDHGEQFLAVAGGDEELMIRVLAKLGQEAVEDLRIDFEDGYGDRGADEDTDAREAANALVRARERGRAAPFNGIRVKSLDPATRGRGIRTLGLFLTTLGKVPDGFVVTLPKVTSVAQVEAMVLLCERLEGEVDGRIVFEIQVETPQSVLGPDGTALVAPMIRAAAGRLTGLHYGTYDYSVACGIAAGQQSLDHPVADHAKAVMQAAAAGTGVRLSDGSTNLLPVGDQLVPAWREHARLVRRSLDRGYYQGWDLHAAQLPTRFAATYGFFREGFAAAAERLRAYAGGADTAILDEPATVRALADFVVRGLDCGALDEAEVRDRTGVAAHTLATLARRPTRTE